MYGLVFFIIGCGVGHFEKKIGQEEFDHWRALRIYMDEDIQKEFRKFMEESPSLALQYACSQVKVRFWKILNVTVLPFQAVGHLWCICGRIAVAKLSGTKKKFCFVPI